MKVKNTFTSDERYGRPEVDLTPFFLDEADQGEIVINAGLSGAIIRYPLSMWFSQRAANEQFPENRAMAGLVRTSRVRAPWYGIAVVLKYGGSRCTRYVDMTEYDLGAVAAYFMTFQ